MSLFKRNKKEEVSETTQPTQTDAIKVVPPKKAIKKASSNKQNKSEIKKGQISYNVLIHPLMTEKINLQMTHNQYVFAINPKSNKIEVKKAIQETYGITPIKVRIMNVLGKAVRSGRGQFTNRKNWKKAIITLPAGKKIDIYES